MNKYDFKETKQMEQLKLFLESKDLSAEFMEEARLLIQKGDITGIIAAAKTKGFETCDADWREYLKQSKEHTGKFTGKQMLDEKELESVSGSGSPVAPCGYVVRWHAGDISTLSPRKRKTGGYENGCPTSGWLGCTWATCLCWGTDNCIDGWHKCKENGNPRDGSYGHW
jgi:hypothetical protein